MRERQSERVTCVCGATVLASYRERHCQTKRHQTIAALLRNRNKAVSALLEEQSRAKHESDAAAETEDELFAAFDRTRLLPRPLGMVRVADDASSQGTTRETAGAASSERWRRPSLRRECEVIEEIDESALPGEGDVQSC